MLNQVNMTGLIAAIGILTSYAGVVCYKNIQIGCTVAGGVALGGTAGCVIAAINCPGAPATPFGWGHATETRLIYASTPSQSGKDSKQPIAECRFECEFFCDATGGWVIGLCTLCNGKLQTEYYDSATGNSCPDFS